VVVLHAALARETKRVRLRAGSVVLPLHHPLRVAEEWAVVDNLSGGRVELSFAPGWNADDFALAPDHYARRHDVMYDGIRTVQRLWAGETIEVTNGAGKPVKVRTYPTPVQPQLVTWVTCAGSPQSFEAAGRLGANLLTHLFDQDVDELAAKIALYRAAREKHGHDPVAGRVAVALHTFLAATTEEVRREAHKPYCEYLKAHASLIEKLAQSRGVPLDVSAMDPRQLDEVIGWIVEKFSTQRALLGTPDECAGLVDRLAAAGVQEIACLLDFGPTADAMRASLPHLKALADRFSRPLAA
jgi:natural product biosynthesis luciferase-like monooxygenase protein